MIFNVNKSLLIIFLRKCHRVAPSVVQNLMSDGGQMSLFHHNLPHSLTIVGFNVHHVNAFDHLRQVNAD